MVDRKRNRQRGFSLVVVFIIILVMVGVSAGVMLSTQGDLQVSGHDREAVSALYAAEAGAAWGKSFVLNFYTPVACTPAFNCTWTAFLNSLAPLSAALCVLPPGGTNPPTTLPVAAAVPSTPGALGPPNPGTPVIYDATRNIYYQWCAHNNASDPTYNPPGAVGGNLNDGDNIITIESWGWVGGNGTLATALASSHITIDVQYANANLLLANDYQQSGGSAIKQARGESSTSVLGGLAKTF